MHRTRAMFVGTASALASIGLVRYPAGAAEFSYKLSLDTPPKHNVTIRCLEAADRISRDSGGRLELKVFPNSQLGSENEVLSQMRLGAVELSLMPDVNGSNVVPAAGLIALPFVVNGDKELLTVLTGGFASYLRGEFSKVGLYMYGGTWETGGFRHIFNSIRPVSTSADMRGLKLRSSPTPEEVGAIKALSATPVSIAQDQVYPSLQTHLVDGAIASQTALEAWKWYELAKYLSISNYGSATETMLANSAALQRLPKNLQDILERNFEISRRANNIDLPGIDTAALERLKSNGMQVNNADIPSLQRAIREAGLYQNWKASYGQTAWTLFERSLGRTVG